MEKQQVALRETLMGNRMTPGALEAAGGPSSSKQSFKLVLGLVAVMGLLIVVLVTAFIYCFPQSGLIASCNQSPVTDPGTFMKNCTWEESDGEKTCDIFTADGSAKYVVYGWVKFPGKTYQQLTLILSDESERNDSRKVEMTADQTQENFFVFKEMLMTKNMKLSLSIPAKLKSCKASRFYVYKV